MWKYKCKNQALVLLGAFALGVLMMVVTLGNVSYTEVLQSVIPDETIAVLTSNPYLLYISGGLAIAGLCNVYLLGNILYDQFGIQPIFWFMLLMFIPDYIIVFGIITAPITLIVSLYGWISLEMGVRGRLKKANISGDSEIIRTYLLHHKLDEKYKEMAVSARKTVGRISSIYILGMVAVLCVMIFVDNLFVTIIAIFGYMFAFQLLARYRISQLAPISNLLYEQCDPEACMSALIYYSQHGKKYKISNRSLMASCLIYLNDPSLAQDVLIGFSRGNVNAVLTYWSLMAYTYYLLKDENGLIRCKEEISKVKTRTGSMIMMIKSTEQASVENKIRLMNRDFQACKQYYLNLLKKNSTKLVQADADYYIALISFVQEDYSIAKLYFEKTLRIGNKLYFVENAKHYLEKIEELDPDSLDEIPYERYLPSDH